MEIMCSASGVYVLKRAWSSIVAYVQGAQAPPKAHKAYNELVLSLHHAIDNIWLSPAFYILLDKNAVLSFEITS